MRYDSTLLVLCSDEESSPNSDLYVTVQLWADSKPLTVPVQTAYRSFKNARTWNEWLELPITIADLPLTSQLAITVWDLSPTGGRELKVMQYHSEARLSHFLTKKIRCRKVDRNVDYTVTKQRMGFRRRRLLQSHRLKEERKRALSLMATIHLRKTSLRDWRSFSRSMKWERFHGWTG